MNALLSGREARISTTLEMLPLWAQKFGRTLCDGDAVCLSGELGSGKTTFLFFLTQELGLSTGAVFSSPTFSIFNQYRTDRFLINHIDLYRLQTYEELLNLDLLGEIRRPDAVSFVEWGDKFVPLLPLYTKRLLFEHVSDQPNARVVHIQETAP